MITDQKCHPNEYAGIFSAPHLQLLVRSLAQVLLPHLTASRLRQGALWSPLLFTISGDLGVGKTTFVQQLCMAFGVTERVSSPTYALVHYYHASHASFLHCDLYRVNTALEIDELDLFALTEAPRLIVVEWADNWLELLPRADVALVIDETDTQNNRRYSITSPNKQVALDTVPACKQALDR